MYLRRCNQLSIYFREFLIRIRQHHAPTSPLSFSFSRVLRFTAAESIPGRWESVSSIPSWDPHSYYLTLFVHYILSFFINSLLTYLCFMPGGVLISCNRERLSYIPSHRGCAFPIRCCCCHY